MPNVVKLLRSTIAGQTPPSLVSGQIAINEADGKLFWLAADGATIRSVTLQNLDALVAGKLTASNNLSDLTSPTAARTNLGLSGAATIDTTNASNISSGTLAAARGGAGTTNGVMKANGSGAVSAAVAGTDFLAPGVAATISKGYAVVPHSIGTPASASTVTPDPANGNYQYLTNNAAFTLAAPSSDCAMDILVTNGSTAGAITMSGFSAPAGGGGDTYATTNASKYLLMIRRINATATYSWKALQ